MCTRPWTKEKTVANAWQPDKQIKKLLEKDVLIRLHMHRHKSL